MRTEQELKENLAKYWRQSNTAFEVPDGTHPDDPNQHGAVVQQPDRLAGQWAASQPPAIQPFDEVHATLLGDPKVAALFQDHWNDAFKPHDLGPPPGDATGQLRWYILRDLNEHHHKRHKLDFEDAKKHRVRQRVEKLFGKLAQSDPLFGLTRDVMDFYVEGLPPSAQRAMQRMFTRCPGDALEFYREIRRIAEKVVRKRHSRKASSRNAD
ncbi:hypothetical protein [Fundidesulfovibrio terrae]|uniref:hypothetical protein n=1 Tax=Fundidesulfovibrio terrae TaxID=2922866 RepID=UPI001FAF8FBC|nr:hypothetical protein [Fundidesulfovibrio terrae]